MMAEIEDIKFPVAELGNCENEEQCETFCDKEENMKVCLDVAEKYDLLPDKEIEMARKMLETGQRTGPGGCRGVEQCGNYCDQISHIKECIEFAKKNNMIPEDELREAELVLAALDRGLEPPPCKGKKDCDEWCPKSTENMKKCITFAKEAGLIPESERADVEKMLAALEKGVAPLPCAGKEGCEKYCGDESHFQQCIEFAKAAGFIGEEEYEMAKKTGGKGPGGCKGKEECEKFCENPLNQQTCFEFAKKYGLISEENLKQMEEGKQKMKEMLNQASPEVIECLKTNFGQNVVEKIQAGEFMPPREEANKIGECFEKFMPRGPEGGESEGQGGPGPAGGPMEGPGGCKTPEECQNFCSQNPEACSQFQGASPEGGQPLNGQYPPPSGVPQLPQNQILPPPPSSFKSFQNLLASMITFLNPK